MLHQMTLIFQIIKGKKMTEEEKKNWLEAIDKTIDEYKKDTHKDYACALCKLASGCLDCLWMKIDGIICLDFVKILGIQEWPFYIPSAKDKYYSLWKSIRLRRLKQWKKMILEDEI